MIDFSLTEQQKMIRETAHRFARDEIRPVAKEYDSRVDPAECFPWDLMKKAFHLGFTKFLISEKYGGYGLGAIDFAILLEELAWGDAGLAAQIGINSLGAEQIAVLGTDAQKERWLKDYCEDETFIISTNHTEPSGGSDNFCPIPDPAFGLKTTAVRNRKHWVLNGQKCFATGVGIAKLYLVSANTDPTKPRSEGTTWFLVPPDTPGVILGKVEDKIGRRLMRNQELFLENVRLTDDDVLGEVGKGIAGLLAIQKPVQSAVIGLGIARACYEEALKYCSERITWGKPIREHQLPAAKLLDMKLNIEAARALLWKLSWARDNPEQASELDGLGQMAKVFCTYTGRQVAIDAMEIMGGVALMRDMPMEKFLRDSLVGPIAGGPNLVRKVLLSANL